MVCRQREHGTAQSAMSDLNRQVKEEMAALVSRQRELEVAQTGLKERVSEGWGRMAYPTPIHTRVVCEYTVYRCGVNSK